MAYPPAFGTPKPEFKSQQPHLLILILEVGLLLGEERSEKYTKYEKARIIGARALQIAQGAPVFIKTEKKNPIDIAMEEFEKGLIPITVKRRRI